VSDAKLEHRVLSFN